MHATLGLGCSNQTRQVPSRSHSCQTPRLVFFKVSSLSLMALQASSQPLNPLPHERPVLRRVGLLLHFGLVAILAVLLVVAANGHMEHAVETPLNEFERVSSTISISLLVFITVRRQSGHEYTYLTHTCGVDL